MEDDVKVTIDGGGINFVRHTSVQKAGQIISFLGFNQVGGVSIQSAQPAQQQVMLQSKVGLRETIVNSHAKTYPQKIAAVALYLRDVEGKESFTQNEIKALFRKLGDEPKNFSRDWSSTVEELRFLHVVDEDGGLYSLTEIGGASASEGFLPTSVKKVGKIRKSKFTRGIREEVTRLEKVTDLEGFPSYHEVNKKGDQILWLLQYGFTHGIKHLVSSEIDYLSSEMQGRIEAKGVQALISGNLKKSFVSKSKEGFAIQKKGENYLKGLLAKE